MPANLGYAYIGLMVEIADWPHISQTVSLKKVTAVILDWLDERCTIRHFL